MMQNARTPHSNSDTCYRADKTIFEEFFLTVVIIIFAIIAQ